MIEPAAENPTICRLWTAGSGPHAVHESPTPERDSRYPMLIEPNVAPLASLQVESARRRQGAQALLWALLITGIETYCRGILSGATEGLEYREAERWIFSPYDRGFTGFANLCEVFALDTRSIRRALLAFRDDPRPEIMALLQRDAA